MTEKCPSFEAEERPIRVLLVEDDPADKDRVRRSIERADSAKFEIDHAVEVEHALAMLQREVHDVVLLDLTLPEGDGIDTLARAKVAAASVPIIALTSEDDPAEARLALEGAMLTWAEADSAFVVRREARALLQSIRGGR